MTGLLLAGLDRLPPQVRRFVVAIVALLALGAVMAALTLSNPYGGHERRLTPKRPAATGPPRTPAKPRRLLQPVSASAMVHARRVAERSIAGYLLFAYGRANVHTVSGITPTLRSRLLHGRARLTPAERRRRARVVSLQTVGTTPVSVVATALIDDGGVTTYRLRFTLQRGAGRWAVSGVEDG